MQELTNKKYWEAEWARNETGKNRSIASSLHLLYPLQKTLGRDLRLPHDVLEVGCCPGDMLLALRATMPNARLVGVDICHDALMSTRTRLDTEDVDVELRNADVMAMEGIEEFDLVVSFGLLEHFVDPSCVIKSMFRLLRPQGLIYVTVPQYNHRLQRAVSATIDPDVWRTHHPLLMNKAGLMSSLSEAGFADIQVGLAGSPSIRTKRSLSDVEAVLVQATGRAWNLFSRTVLRRPIFGWGTMVWGIGRKI